MSEVTQILEAIRRGKEKAAEELLPLVYEELPRLAAHKIALEMPATRSNPPRSFTKPNSSWLATVLLPPTNLVL